MTAIRPEFGSLVNCHRNPVYQAGGIVTDLGVGVAAVGAGVAIFGGGNPVTNVVGGGIAAFGGVGIAVGTIAQVAAGGYYALHGNWKPLGNVAISKAFGIAKTPKIGDPSKDKFAQGVVDALGEDQHECKP